MPRLEPYTPTAAGGFSRLFMMVTPVVIGVLCVLLSFVPISRIFGSSLMPAFAFMAIYYWAVVRPELFPAWAVLALGLLSDLLSGGPIGLWAFVYLVSYWAILSQRFLVMNAAFSMFWAGFVLAATVAGALAWVVASILYTSILPAQPVLWHMAITIAVFPLFALLFGRIQRRVNPLS